MKPNPNFAPHSTLPRLKREATLLLMVDIQERLMPAIYHAPEVEKNCILLARAALQLKIPILITEQNPARLGSTLSAIMEIVPQNQPVSKMSFSAGVPEIIDAFQASGRKTVLLCGVESHVCVLQTALDLLDTEYSVFAARDAVASRTVENAQIGWERMMHAGVLPTSVESAIFELLESAGTPDFKALLPFLK